MSAEMGQFTLRADPAKIQATAGSLKTKIGKLRTELEALVSKVESTANYWNGDAAEAYRRDFKEEQPEFDEAIRRLDEHVTDLYNIASVYTGAEQINVNVSEALLSDVIE